jgi:hypothetical protein
VFVATDAWYESFYNLTGIAAFPLAGAILSDNTRECCQYILPIFFHLRLLFVSHGLSDILTPDLLVNWRFMVDYNASCGAAIDCLYNDTESGVLPVDNTPLLVIT